jgi:hypothetical protein
MTFSKQQQAEIERVALAAAEQMGLELRRLKWDLSDALSRIEELEIRVDYLEQESGNNTEK